MNIPHRRSLAERILAQGTRLEHRRGQQPGYPNLFLRTGSATRLLTEISALAPVTADRHPALETLSQPGDFVQNVAKRLEWQGLVERRKFRQRRITYFLRKKHPLFEQISDLLQTLRQINGLPEPAEHPRPGRPPTALPPREGQLFGEKPHPVYTLFGGHKRTEAILLVAALGYVDKTSIADFVKTEMDTAIMHLLDPIERDGIFEPEALERFVIYRIPDAPWKGPLHRLALAAAKLDPLLGSRIAATRAKMRVGRQRRKLREHLDGDAAE